MEFCRVLSSGSVSLVCAKSCRSTVNFHHRSIPHCASILEPLNNLLATPQEKDGTLKLPQLPSTK